MSRGKGVGYVQRGIGYVQGVLLPCDQSHDACDGTYRPPNRCDLNSSEVEFPARGRGSGHFRTFIRKCPRSPIPRVIQAVNQSRSGSHFVNRRILLFLDFLFISWIISAQGLPGSK